MSPMESTCIEPLWSKLWARRFGSDDVRLRFELGGVEFDNDRHSVPRFIQALHRASTVADMLFHENCVGIVAWNGRVSHTCGIPDVACGFDALRFTGFEAAQISEWQATLYPDPDDDEAYVWTVRSYEISHNKSARDTILWHAIAEEMPIQPSAPVVTFLFDPANLIMLHAYDDRGMDVMADDPAKLSHAYSIFREWLLEHDRERMDNLF